MSVTPIGPWGIRVSAQPAEARRGDGRQEGLFGDFDGDSSDDIRPRGGQPIVRPTFAELYPAFADSWRVAPATSLFTYGPGVTTDTFTDRTFPDREVTLDDLPGRAAADALCRRRGVTDPASPGRLHLRRGHHRPARLRHRRPRQPDVPRRPPGRRPGGHCHHRPTGRHRPPHLRRHRRPAGLRGGGLVHPAQRLRGARAASPRRPRAGERLHHRGAGQHRRHRPARHGPVCSDRRPPRRPHRRGPAPALHHVGPVRQRHAQRARGAGCDLHAGGGRPPHVRRDGRRAPVRRRGVEHAAQRLRGAGAAGRRRIASW